MTKKPVSRFVYRRKFADDPFPTCAFETPEAEAALNKIAAKRAELILDDILRRAKEDERRRLAKKRPRW